jgi:hypothetical protein
METLQYDDSDVKATPRSSASEITAHLSKRKTLIFKICSTFFLFCRCGKKKKKLLYNKAKERLHRDLDIMVYMNTIRNVEFLTKVLLSKA